MFCPRCEMYTDKPCEQCNYPYDFDPIYDCEFRADVAHALCIKRLEKEKENNYVQDLQGGKRGKCAQETGQALLVLRA